MFISGVNNSDDIVRLDLWSSSTTHQNLPLAVQKIINVEINNLQDYPAYNLQEFNF